MTAAGLGFLTMTVPYGWLAVLRLDGRIAGPTHGAGVRTPAIPLEQRWGRAVVELEGLETGERRVIVEARRDAEGRTRARWRTGMDYGSSEGRMTPYARLG